MHETDHETRQPLVLERNLQDARSLRPRRHRAVARAIAPIALVASLVFLATWLQPGSAKAAGTLVPLYNWWSPTLQDNFATTDPAWAASTRGTIRGAYRFERVLGYVFDPTRPQPRGTRKLFRWWSPSRGDQFVTTAGNWDPAVNPTPTPDYAFQRMEGFVLDRSRAGTRPLTNWYDPTREDNFMTSEPEWGPTVGTTRGSYTRFAVEGHVVSPPGSEDFGYGTATARDRNGEANPVRAEGVRPVLVIPLSYSDLRVRKSDEYFEQLVFGPGYPNVADYFRENSYGKFTWIRGDVIAVTYPGTRAAAGAAGNASIGATVISRAAANGFDFCAQDRTGPAGRPDGKVTLDELAVVWMGATPAPSPGTPPEAWGQTVPQTSPAAVNVTCPTGGSVEVHASTAGIAEDEAIPTIVHELVHQLGPAHIYGSGNSPRMSIMSGTLGDYTSGHHIDPFTKIQLGWVKPRVYATTNPGAATHLAAATGCFACPAPEPIILYDPSRGKNEYFILEFRRRTPGTYDAFMADPNPGVAIWYVRTDAAGRLLTVPGRGGLFDETNWIVGSPFSARGQSTLWNTSHGEVVLDSASIAADAGWFDGSDANMRLRVGIATSTGIDVDWRNATLPLPSARVDELRGSSAAPGGTFAIEGDFGTEQGGRVVRLVHELFGRRALEVLRWSATTLTVRVPVGTPAGTYQVTVYDDASYSVASNTLPLTVLAG